MSKFAIDQNGQRIIRFKDEMPQGAAFNEGYVLYAIPLKDIDTLVAELKENGYIKEEAPDKTIYDSPDTQIRNIMDVQANMLDRQLSIIEMMLNKK